MHEREDMTFQEIADATKEPMNTVKSRYRRALASLRERLLGTL
jgi:DNA-directed RNA polymerase specialized sigma24 family protein